MSWMKKALERAKAERTTGEPPAQEPARPFEASPECVAPVYARTRTVEVSRDGLIENRIVALDLQNPVTDQFKLLRTRIFHRSRAQGWNTLQITGFNNGEGKSLVAANLAISIAQDARQTTLLVDLDFRNPSLQRLFGLGDDVAGLSAYFTQETPLEEILINPGIDKLTILPAGDRIAQAPELMGSPRMEALVKELKHRYCDRYILFDTPPVNECPDPLVFSEYVDAVILVARAEQTTLESIQSAMSLVPRDKVLGVVLNDSQYEETRDYTYYGSRA